MTTTESGMELPLPGLDTEACQQFLVTVFLNQARIITRIMATTISQCVNSIVPCAQSQATDTSSSQTSICGNLSYPCSNPLTSGMPRDTSPLGTVKVLYFGELCHLRLG